MLHVPPAHAADVAVRAGPDAPPVVAAPVRQVVPAVRRPAFGPVEHLVPAEARLRQELVGDQVAVGEDVVVRASGARRGGPGAASRVPSSTISEYALTWSGSAASAASSDARQSSSDSPGVP